MCDVSAGTCSQSGKLGAAVVPMQAKLPAFVTFAIKGLEALGDAATVKDCGDSSYVAHFSSPTISPTSPVKGQPCTLTGQATATAAVSGGNYAISAKLNGARVFSHNGNACGSDKISLPLGFGTINYTGPTCPVASGGAFDVNMEITVPSAAPSASYTFQVDSTTSSGSKFFCLEVDFKL